MMKFERLGDLVNIQIGKTPKREVKPYWGKGHPWVSIADLKGREIHYTKEQITDLAVKECGCKLIEKGTLLLSFKLSIGKIAFAGTDLYTNEAICGLKIIDSSKVFPEYLFYALKSIKFGGSNTAAKGSTLNTASLNALKIPFPETLSDQIKIATVLRKAEDLIALRQKSISLLDDFLRNTFLKMFGDPIKNNLSFPKGILKDVCLKIQDGTHFSPPITETGIPYITAKHVRENIIDFWANPWFISENSHREIYKRCDPIKGDVIYIKDGATTGYAAINKYDFQFSMLSSLALLRPNNKLLNPEYLCYWLNSRYVKKRILTQMAGGAIKRLTLSKINKISILIPDIVLQNEFSIIVERAEVLKEKLKRSLIELEELYASLSKNAFKGELDLRKLIVEYEEEYSATDNDRTEPRPVNYEKVSARPKRIPEMSLDDYYSVPEDVQAEHGSIEQHIFDWEFFFKKHFSDRPITSEVVEALYHSYNYERGYDFDHEEFATVIFEELKKEKSYLEQRFIEETKQIILTVKNETAQA